MSLYGFMVLVVGGWWCAVMANDPISATAAMMRADCNPDKQHRDLADSTGSPDSESGLAGAWLDQVTVKALQPLLWSSRSRADSDRVRSCGLGQRQPTAAS